MMNTTTISDPPVLLSQEQQELVLHNGGEGALLVVAAAGSGKTRILTERVRYLLTQKSGKFSVLCLTFTNKAAEEMQERLSTVPEIQRRAFIGTLHGFALQILTARRHDLGYADMPHILERDNDRKKVVEQVFLENPLLKGIYDQKESKEQQKLLDKCLSWLCDQKRNLVFVEDGTTEYKGWQEGHLLFFTSYNQLLREQNMVDFEDILLLAYRILTEFPAVARLYQRLYQYILVDEAQDLNFAQYQLVKALCGEAHQNVFMVGDPNQAIHGYAGASRKYMLQDFITDFGAVKKEIYKNYRSSQAVIRFANQVMPNGTKHEDAHYMGFVQIKAFADEKEEATWVFQTIQELLNQAIPDFVKRAQEGEIEGEISLDKIAVLARNKFVFRSLEELLKSDDYFRRNYFVKKSTEAMDMETDLMRLFDLGTRILCNPSNQLHFQQILRLLNIADQPVSTERNGYTKLELLLPLLQEGSTKRKDFETLLEGWQKLTGATVRMPEALSKLKSGVEESNISDEEKELLLFDIGDYEENWSKFLRHSSSSGMTLAAFRQFVAMGSNATQKNKGLTLANIHTVKGLQFDIIFLIGMTDSTFPDYRSHQVEKQLEEERNGAYVAVTRAKRWLFVTYPQKKWMPWGDWKAQSPSRFIQPMLNE